MSKVCVFFAEGYEEIEALTVVDLLRRAGIETQMVSVTGNKQVMSSHKVPVIMDALLSDVNFDEVDMIVLPGGMPGTKNLENCAELMAQVDAFVQAGKYVAAICAAPSILGHRGILQGRRACCYPEYEEELTGAEVTRNSVEIAGNVITSRGMGCAIDFSLAIVSVYKGQNAAKELAEKVVYSR